MHGPVNLLLLAPTHPHNPQVEAQLDQITNEAEAVRHYLRARLRAVWNQLTTDSQQIKTYKQFYFDALIHPLHQRKLQQINQARIRKFYSSLRANVQAKAARRQWVVQKLQKSEQIRVKKIMQEWKEVAHIERATKRLEIVRKKEQVGDLLLFLRQNLRNAQLRKQNIEAKNYSCNDIHSHNLLNKAFTGLKLNAKFNLLLRIIRSPRLAEFLTCLKNYNKQSTRKSAVHFQQKLKISCFYGWKEQYRTEVALRFHTSNLLTNSFHLWRSRIPELISQRQIQQNNDCITTIFLERSQQKMMKRVLLGWHEYCRETKENRHHNAVLNKYADATCRQSLLRRYFEMLRINCLNGQVKRRFHQIKLKRKVIDALKIILTQSIVKQEKVINFIQQRECRKYFERIKLFNRLQREKVNKFRMAKLFHAFSFTIVSHYFHKNNQADAYNRTNLLFKTVVALKKAVHFRHQQSYLIAQINVKAPLRRWHCSFTIKRFIDMKKWERMKGVMREWKLRVIRRDTDRKIVREFNEFESSRKSDSKMEVFEFDNIMATIAKIRSNFLAEQTQTHQPPRFPANHTASESINFSYSLQND